jgi:death-on-curing protein
MQISGDMMQISEYGTFDIAHLEPWLRSFASSAD